MCVVLMLVTCIGMASCSKSYKVDDYSIVRDNGEYFIIFDDITIYQNGGLQQLGILDFSSMKEFKDSVTKGTLTDSQKRIMATSFKKDENGAILACDFDNLFVPTLPKTGSVATVSWTGGKNYSFELTFGNEMFGWLSYMTKESYTSRYQKNYLNLFERESIEVTSTENLGDNKVAIYHSTSAGELKNIRYSLTDGEKTIIVDKTFRLRMDNPKLETSSTVPSEIILYCEDSEERYVITLYGFVEDPTDDWLLSFGIEEFTE